MLLLAAAGRGEQRCPNVVGKLVSVQGEAHVQRGGETSWIPVYSDETFCSGDKLRVQQGARAAVVLENETVIRINQQSTINFAETAENRFSVLGLIKGMMHIFSHRPRSLKVVTPYVNGTVEGTEFMVSANADEAVFTVFEGRVSAVNEQGRLDITGGQSVAAGKGAPPQYRTLVSPRDGVAWTLYYPVVFDAGADLENDVIRQASQMLSVGQVAEAQRLLGEILHSNSENSDAVALLSIIAVVQNDKAQALRYAERAVVLSPDSAAAALALSYARQAHFDIDGALKALLEADRLSQMNGELKARLAELLLATGNLDEAVETAGEAAQLNPDISRTQSVLGFAYLARIEIDQSLTAFQRAVSLDQALPLARLGLGLCYISRGEVEKGRAELEIAAALDPGNGLIRSYLGKAYFEEKRDSLSGRQFTIAKELDPQDPTPWFYDAIRKQSENRPVEALYDLQKSIELNDNRASGPADQAPWRW